MQRQRRIAICGGGPGGLALAVTIGKFNPELAVDVYEAGSEITTVGAGITMWKRTWQVMQRVGLADDLAKRTNVPPLDEPSSGLTWRKSNIKSGGYTFSEQIVPYGKIPIHRADLLDVLRDHLPKSCTIHLNKRLTHYTTRVSHPEEQSGSTAPVTLHFTDGSTAATDVLIGADGIKSPTRKTMYENLAKEKGDETLLQHCHPIWSGAVAYRNLIPHEKLEKVWPNHRAQEKGIIYCGKGKHLVAYPVSQGKFVNVAAFDTKRELEGTPFPHEKWVSDVPTSEGVEAYDTFEPEAKVLMECMENPSRWAIHVLKPLDQWVHGNVALIGDASHAMRPCFGAGAGSAIEDAYVLGRLLALPNASSIPIPTLLKIYEQVRLPLGNELLIGARLTGFLYDFEHEGYADGFEHLRDANEDNGHAVNGDSHTPSEREQEVMKRQGEAIMAKWHKVHFETVPDDDWAQAEGLVKQALAVQAQ
jgi:salicylate hydroxylase